MPSVTKSTERPNVIVLGVDHSGTSIVTRMLHTMGWEKGDADERFSESVSVRDVNKKTRHRGLFSRGRFDSEKAATVLAAIPQSWAIKDPRFVHTLDNWLPLLNDYKPTLIWLVRNPEAVTESHRKRGQKVRCKLTAEQANAVAGEKFASWPWGKVRVEYEALQAAVALFDINRG
jgi:hypothetical protein